MDWRACFIYQYHKTNNCMLQRSKTQYNVGLSELNDLPDFVVLSKICDSGGISRSSFVVVKVHKM